LSFGEVIGTATSFGNDGTHKAALIYKVIVNVLTEYGKNA
jgi:hypothetical protein